MNSGLARTEKEVVVVYLNLLSCNLPEVAEENKILSQNSMVTVLWTLRCNNLWSIEEKHKIESDFKTLS